MRPVALRVSEGIHARAAGLLESLCSISSSSSDRDGLYRMAERVARELADFGLQVEIHDEEGLGGDSLPLLIARNGGSAESPRLLLLGHLDTVLPAVTPRWVNGSLCATGALDMKGGIAALVGALLVLREADEALPDNLVFVAVPDEEVGGPISARAVARWGEGAHTVLILEPGAGRESGVETLVTGRRGLSIWRLEARGTAAHSGVSYWDGRSALAAAATWAGGVQQMSEKGDGPIVNVGRIVGGDSDFVSDFGEEHRFIGTTERLNVVADRCVVEGELRYLDPSDRGRVLTRMRDLASKLASEWSVTIEFEEVEQILPLTPSPTGNSIAKHLIGLARRDGWSLEVESDRGGISFPNYLPDPRSIPVIDGLGPVGDGMHTRGEYLDLESLRRRVVLIAEALVYIRNQR